MTHIAVRFIPEGAGQNVADYQESARQTCSLVEKTLGFQVDELEIEVFSSRQQWIDEHTQIDEAGLRTWVTGDSGRIIRVVIDEQSINREERLRKMISHECVHAIVRSIGGGAIPAWLDEGLAISLSGGLTQSYISTLERAVHQEAVLPLEVLENPFTVLERDLKTLAYAQSFSLVLFLRIRFGWPPIAEIVRAIGRGESIERGVRPLGLNSYLLEKEWLINFPQMLKFHDSAHQDQVG